MCNRAAVMQFKSGQGFANLTDIESDDVSKLVHILSHLPPIADAGAGGTTFRFALAALASTPAYVGFLTGTEQLLSRPVEPLFQALLAMGANITKVDNNTEKGFLIKGKSLHANHITMNGNVSSQFITAVLLAVCNHPNDFCISVDSPLTSAPYLSMTIDMLQKAGKQIAFNNHEITMKAGMLKNIPVELEHDWSSASYAYAFAALSKSCDIVLDGLHLKSLQWDAQMAEVFRAFGVISTQNENGITLKKNDCEVSDYFEWNCSNFPDMAQTLAVVVAGLKAKAKLTGLHTLTFKETNRLLALKHELVKLNVLVDIENNNAIFINATEANFSQSVSIATYHDHRMALAFAPLALKLPSIIIQNHMVVQKSWPNFWEQLRINNFLLTELYA